MTNTNIIKIDGNTVEVISETLHITDINNKTEWTSVELVDVINHFRTLDGKKTMLQHKTLLEIIRDEFNEEINEQNFLPVNFYTDKKGEQRPMYKLSNSQAKQILVRESKAVRRAVINLLEYLEQHNEHNLNVLNEREAYLYEQGLIIDTVDKMADLIKKTKELSNKKDICQRIINLINASQSSVPLPTRTHYTTTYN
ncbi:hypothetical protein [Gemella haemolysans]|uniref:Phage regulatory protein Rha (Phage_pRha) n=2 Tax=Gemella haemolysans TaxID=1379 RepID=A0AA87BAZ2_9BACL|nr:hypothetical protein [Gemella haemolysans]EGF88123.1 hypothetical protein HMPREF0428_01238 [Gemella haemolysans M341]QIX88556.1 hypothetical protein FOC48_07140 [Gemella haemolysans]